MDVRDMFVLALAAGLAGFVVWRMTYGPSPASTRRAMRRRRIRFEETLEITGAPAAEGHAATAFTFVPARDERPHRFRSLIAIATTIFLVAAGGAALFYFIGHFVRLAIENLINS